MITSTSTTRMIVMAKDILNFGSISTTRRIHETRASLFGCAIEEETVLSIEVVSRVQKKRIKDK